MEENIVGDVVQDNGSGNDMDAPAGNGEAQEEVETEIVRPKVARNPMQPTERQRELHRMLHLPFRDWCAECVQGRGKDRYHLRIEDEDGVPRIGMDYMFLSEKGVTHKSDVADEWTKNGECIAILVIKDFRHKSIWAYPVESKGMIKSSWLVDQIIEDLDTCGLDRWWW